LGHNNALQTKTILSIAGTELSSHDSKLEGESFGEFSESNVIHQYLPNQICLHYFFLNSLLPDKKFARA